MYLCVLDFEATCWTDPTRKNQMEIIEFPSVLYKIDNNTVSFIAEFHKYVKPTINPILSEFCTELTGIQQQTVDSADTIDNVYEKHHKWLIDNTEGLSRKIVFATCGHWDLRTMLPLELKNKGLKRHTVYSKYINVKDEFEYFYKRKAGGMTDMLKKLKIELTGRHHSGIDDTRNIAKIMLEMINSGHKILSCRLRLNFA